MVRIQAQTIRRVTPQRTAERRRVAPTPTIAPVMVCVVLTWNSENGVANDGDPAGCLGREAAKGRKFGDALAHGFDDAPAARHGSATHRQVTADDDPERDGKFPADSGVKNAARDKRGGDDAHAFL